MTCDTLGDMLTAADLISQSNKALEESGALSDLPPDLPPVTAPDPSAVPPTKPNLWKSYARMLDSVTNRLSSKRKELAEKLAWRCDVFLPSGEFCNTANGLASNRDYARKYCTKCARAKANPFTLEQEIAREHLIESLMDMKGLSYAEARRQVDEANEIGNSRDGKEVIS